MPWNTLESVISRVAITNNDDTYTVFPKGLLEIHHIAMTYPIQFTEKVGICYQTTAIRRCFGFSVSELHHNLYQWDLLQHSAWATAGTLQPSCPQSVLSNLQKPLSGTLVIGIKKLNPKT